MTCEYCAKGIAIIDEPNMTVYIDVDEICVELYFDGYESAGSEHKSINYCPMCGRELRGEPHE